MAKITLKDIPIELRAWLKNEAAELTTKRDQQWIDEAVASGPTTPLSRKEMDAIRNRVLKRKKS